MLNAVCWVAAAFTAGFVLIPSHNSWILCLLVPSARKVGKTDEDPGSRFPRPLIRSGYWSAGCLHNSIEALLPLYIRFPDGNTPDGHMHL